MQSLLFFAVNVSHASLNNSPAKLRTMFDSTECIICAAMLISFPILAHLPPILILTDEGIIHGSPYIAQVSLLNIPAALYISSASYLMAACIRGTTSCKS
jgi:hypothetical protein